MIRVFFCVISVVTASPNWSRASIDRRPNLAPIETSGSELFPVDNCVTFVQLGVIPRKKPTGNTMEDIVNRRPPPGSEKKVDATNKSAAKSDRAPAGPDTEESSSVADQLSVFIEQTRVLARRSIGAHDDAETIQTSLDASKKSLLNLQAEQANLPAKGAQLLQELASARLDLGSLDGLSVRDQRVVRANQKIANLDALVKAAVARSRFLPDLIKQSGAEIKRASDKLAGTEKELNELAGRWLDLIGPNEALPPAHAEAAIKICSEQIDFSPRCGDLHLAHAMLSYHLSQNKNAEASLNKLMNEASHFTPARSDLFRLRAHLLQSLLQARTGDHQAARKGIAQVRKIAPKDYHFLVSSGEVYLAGGQAKEAYQYFDRSINARASDDTGYRGTANAILMGDPHPTSQAIIAAQDAIQRDKSDWRNYATLEAAAKRAGNQALAATASKGLKTYSVGFSDAVVNHYCKTLETAGKDKP